MIQTANPLTAEDVRQIILEVSVHLFPSKTIEEVELIMRNMIGFTVDEAVQSQSTTDAIRSEVQLAYLVDSEEYPEADECQYGDPKDDMGFWRTGIRVSPL